MKNNGILYACTAFLIWGLIPVLWRQLSHLNLYGLLSYRVLCSFITLAIVIILTKKQKELWALIKSPRAALTLLFTSTLLISNWGIFAWGVNSGHVLECGLGYFINPLLNVLLGVGVLKEKLNRWQFLSILLAASGIIYLFTQGVGAPWISVALAGTFGVYGLIRKMGKITASLGLFVECLFMAPIAVYYLSTHPELNFNQLSASTHLLIASTGLVTVIPLILFAKALHSLKLSTVGILQYIAPTFQFLQAVFLFGEPFRQAHLITFSLIWLALGIYSYQLFYQPKI